MDSNEGGGQPQQPELTGKVLFYNNPTPLTLEAHKNLGVKQVPNPFAFLRAAHAIPVTVSEFGIASTSYPIIFVGEEKTPVAVTGVRQGENEFVDDQGVPDPDHYVPAFARRYPFVFAADQDADRLLLCVDTTAPMVSDQPEVAFFEGDQPSKFTQDAMEFCKEFERQRRSTAEFMKMLDEADLLEQKTVSFTPRDANGQESQPQKIADYYAVSEEKLQALDPAKFNELKEAGALPAIYAHMVSLLNWPRIIQRAMRRLQSAQAQATQTPVS